MLTGKAIFTRLSLGAMLLGAKATLVAVTVTIGSITIETDNSVQTATLSTQGTITTSTFNAPIQGVSNPPVDDAHHVGALVGGAGGSAVDLTNGTSGASGRSTIELLWGASAPAENVTGDDLYVVESGNFTGPNGFPEAFAVAVREEGSGVFSAYRYEFFEAGDVATAKLVTAYDFSDFGLALGARVDAIRIISLHNASAITPPNLEDRATDSSGAGVLTLDAGGSTGFALQQGPLSGAPGTYPDSAMDADIVYVAAKTLAGPSNSRGWELYK